jgi:hypothetical protein
MCAQTKFVIHRHLGEIEDVLHILSYYYSN